MPIRQTGRGLGFQDKALQKPGPMYHVFASVLGVISDRPGLHICPLCRQVNHCSQRLSARPHPNLGYSYRGLRNDVGKKLFQDPLYSTVTLSPPLAHTACQVYLKGHDKKYFGPWPVSTAVQRERRHLGFDDIYQNEKRAAT